MILKDSFCCSYVYLTDTPKDSIPRSTSAPMASFSLGPLRGLGMIILQFLRAFTVITLAAAGVSCWILIIKVDKSRGYFVFECASNFFTSAICLLLIVSELPPSKLVRDYFRRAWPVISDQHGTAWLGFAMVIIGCDILGNLNKPARVLKNIDSHFLRLVLAASVLSVTLGILNVLGSVIWSDSEAGITSRDVRADGSLATPQQEALPENPKKSKGASPSLRNEKVRSKFASMFWKSGQGEKSKPKISLPLTACHDVENAAVVERCRSISEQKIKRPDSALHPIYASRSSRYSEAQMSRF